jgi:hypothetical protein
MFKGIRYPFSPERVNLASEKARVLFSPITLFSECIRECNLCSWGDSTSQLAVTVWCKRTGEGTILLQPIVVARTRLQVDIFLEPSQNSFRSSLLPEHKRSWNLLPRNCLCSSLASELCQVTDSISVFPHSCKWTRIKKEIQLCKIWSIHGGDYDEWRLLGCYAVWLL